MFELSTVEGSQLWRQLGDAIRIGVARLGADVGDGFGHSLSMSSDGALLAISTINPNCDIRLLSCPTGSIRLYQYRENTQSSEAFELLPYKRDTSLRTIIIMEESEFRVDLSSTEIRKEQERKEKE